MIPRPPQLNGYEVKQSKTLRFTTNAAYASSITYQNLLDTILMTTTAIAPFDLFYAVRINRLRCWALPTIGQSTSVTCTFDGFGAGFVGDREVHTDASMGIEPAYLSCSPSKQSLASKFQVSSSQAAFFLDVPAQCVVDVDLTFRSDTVGVVVAAQNASVGATVGLVAFRGLDGLALATSKFTVPNGINTI